MKLLMYGVNKDTVMKEDTEKYFLDNKKRQDQMMEIASFNGVEEIAVLSNNFRNEYYLYVNESIFSHGDFLRYIAEETKKSLQEIILETYSKFNEDVLRHLFEVATGFISEPIGSVVALGSVEEALFFSKKLNTIGEVITRMFQNAIDLAFELKLDESTKPLNLTKLSTYLYLLIEQMDDLEKKNYLVSGTDLEVYFLTKVLLKAEARSISIIHDDEMEAERQTLFVKQILNEINQTKVYPITSKSLYYRLSKVDAAILDTSKINLFDETICEEVAIIRQTKKVQYLIDTGDHASIELPYSNLDIRVINTKNNHLYSEDELINANVILDEKLSIHVKEFMDYLDSLQTNVVEKELLF